MTRVFQSQTGSQSARPLDGRISGGDRDALPGELLRSALWFDAGVIALVVSRDGRIHESSEAARTRMPALRENPVCILADVLPPAVCDERLDLVSLALEHNRPVRVEGLVGGVRTLTTIRPIDDERVLMTSRECLTGVVPESDSVHTLKARCNDAGPLEQLTAREVEVLRHIGRGLSTAAIADELHRSVKTIEWHRVSLGNKLGINNRVELARIAIAAGLSPLDPADDTTNAAEHNGNGRIE